MTTFIEGTMAPYTYIRYRLHIYTTKRNYVIVARIRRSVWDNPMPCKPGVTGLIPGYSQSVG